MASADGFELVPAPPAPPQPVPGEIANWRAKAVLGLAGMLPAVEKALNAMPEPARTIALAAWNGGADLARNGPTVLAIAPVLNLTDAQVDDMFRQAAALNSADGFELVPVPSPPPRPCTEKSPTGGRKPCSGWPGCCLPWKRL